MCVDIATKRLNERNSGLYNQTNVIHNENMKFHLCYKTNMPTVKGWSCIYIIRWTSILRCELWMRILVCVARWMCPPWEHEVSSMLQDEHRYCGVNLNEENPGLCYKTGVPAVGAWSSICVARWAPILRCELEWGEPWSVLQDGCARSGSMKFHLCCKMSTDIAVWTLNEENPGLCCKTSVSAVGTGSSICIDAHVVA